jgi:hypothetical protein
MSGADWKQSATGQPALCFQQEKQGGNSALHAPSIWPSSQRSQKTMSLRLRHLNLVHVENSESTVLNITSPLAYILNTDEREVPNMCDNNDNLKMIVKKVSSVNESTVLRVGTNTPRERALIPMIASRACENAEASTAVSSETRAVSPRRNCHSAKERGYWDVVLNSPPRSPSNTSRSSIDREGKQFRGNDIDKDDKSQHTSGHEKLSRKPFGCHQCHTSFDYQSHLRTRKLLCSDKK